MKQLNKTVLLLLIALIVTLVSSGTYAFFFIATRDKTQATADLLAKSAELSGKEAHIASSLSVAKSESINTEKLASYFIKESEIVTFAKTLEDLGPQSGTNLSLESLDPGLTERSIPYLSFRIKAIGKFADIERLLILIENFPGKLEWKTVRILRDGSLAQEAVVTSQRTAPRNPEWSVDIFLTAFNFVNE